MECCIQPINIDGIIALLLSETIHGAKRTKIRVFAAL